MTKFPEGFLWGASTASHQIEGNNTNNDCWFAEHVQPTIFKEPSEVACDSYNRWSEDLDLVKSMGLNTYRFSLEWSRIEPAEGTWDEAAIAHYEAIIDRCIQLGLEPVVTYNHFTVPHWFAAKSGWLNPNAPELFARFCGKVTAAFGHKLKYVITMNEPNLAKLLEAIGLPDFVQVLNRQTLEACSAKAGVEKYRVSNVILNEEAEAFEQGLEAAHIAARKAIKAANPQLKVGLSIAMTDELASPADDPRAIAAADAMRERLYGRWVRLAAHTDDFIGVQNYSRNVWLADGTKAPSDPALPQNQMHTEVWAPSLAGCVRWAHQQTGINILVTEHGVGSQDDSVRADLIPAALAELRKAIAEGVPVLGYCHWSLMDNFEWIFGYEFQFGLVEVDREHDLKRTRKPSSFVYERIARANSL